MRRDLDMKIGNGSPLLKSFLSAVSKQPGLYSDLQNKSSLISTISGKQAGKLNLVDVEKHLDDYKKGKANLSKETAAKLNSAEDEIFGSLLNTDIEAQQKFGAYLTALSYDQRARFVENLGGLSDNIQRIKKVFDTEA